MKLHLRFYTFTMNYFFIDLSTNNKKKQNRGRDETWKTIRSVLFRDLCPLSALGPDWAPVRIRRSDEVRWVPRPRLRFGEPLWAALPSWWELSSTAVLKGTMPLFFPGASTLSIFTHTTVMGNCGSFTLSYELNQVYIDLTTLAVYKRGGGQVVL